MNKINYVNVAKVIENNSRLQKYVLLPFYKNGKPLENERKWGMTLLTASSMRFRWNEKNEEREQLFKKIVKENFNDVCSGECATAEQKCDCKHKFVSVELIHSKTVFNVQKEEEVLNKKGDGIVTGNNLLIPSVTVADCVPLFLYDNVKNVAGIVHSGWKGTGIIENAIKMFVEEYSSNIEDICVTIGPHICSKCYCVDEERKNYFLNNFGECVTKADEKESDLKKTGDGKLLNFHLSLTAANLFAIKKSGILEENITVATDCTCCTQFSGGSFVFGSFRRQAAFLSENIDEETRKRSMTVQAAFIL